ncbi:MAG TPA: ABC transporter permease [Gemmataceae bacterium]|nr:ABC transporter permease [Gemmataceae bacterium]
MKRQHLQAFLWLRWRLRVNQMKRGGLVNTVIQAILAVVLVLLAGVLFVGSFLVGLFLLDEVAPVVLLYVWDGLVVAFLFFWGTGLLSELQRSESLSLEKFLHLPVSLSSAFLINYLSSLFSVVLILFVPAMLGLSLGLIFARGPMMLLVLPLLAAFVLMITAITYQFQGWLAALMVNQRRRRTIIVVATMVFILLCQLPNLLNLLRPWERQQGNELSAHLSQQQTELQRALDAKEITFSQYQNRQAEIQREFQNQVREAEQQARHHVESAFRLVNLLLPPGWLPLGVWATAEGEVAPALLGILGLTLLGTASLWRSYRTTLRLYTGQFTAQGRQAISPLGSASRRSEIETSETPIPPTRLLERQLPFVSEQATAIALSAFRSLTRAPEAKMMLLTPILMLAIFGSMFFTQHTELPVAVRPLLPFGTMVMILFSMVQLVGNQFGFDRGGFRVFVLCPARRRDILLGKNLAVAPLALGLGAAAAIVVEVMVPMRADHFLAVLVQLISMYLLFCVLANWLSILAPMPITAGSFKPANPRGLTLLLHMIFVFLLPLALAPTLLPLGVELGMEEMGWVRGVPIYLLLSLLECTAIVWLYRLVLNWQGGVLQAREQKILQLVTAKTE